MDQPWQVWPLRKAIIPRTDKRDWLVNKLAGPTRLGALTKARIRISVNTKTSYFILKSDVMSVCQRGIKVERIPKTTHLLAQHGDHHPLNQLHYSVLQPHLGRIPQIRFAIAEETISPPSSAFPDFIHRITRIIEPTWLTMVTIN